MTNKHDDMPTELMVWEDVERPHIYHGDELLNLTGTHYTRTDTIPKQEVLDPDTIMIKRNVLEKLDNAIVRANLALVRNNEIDRAMDLTDASQAIDEILEPVKETQNPLHLEKTCKENAEILADKDRVMDMMAAALKTCEWIRDENGHDWFHYDEEKVAQALKEYKRLLRHRGKRQNS